MPTTTAHARRHRLLAIALVALAAVAGLAWLASGRPDGPRLDSALLYPRPRALPDFILTQADGRPLTLADWRGRWNLVFLGYTSCPDVCPTTLQTFKSAWNELGKRGLTDKLRIDFVSVDPERDTPERLAGYVGFFSPSFVAATGSDVELTKVAHALGLLYARTKKADGEVNVEHSGSVAIVDPQGRLVGTFRPPYAAKDLVADMARLLAEH